MHLSLHGKGLNSINIHGLNLLMEYYHTPYVGMARGGGGGGGGEMAAACTLYKIISLVPSHPCPSGEECLVA